MNLTCILKRVRQIVSFFFSMKRYEYYYRITTQEAKSVFLYVLGCFFFLFLTTNIFSKLTEHKNANTVEKPKLLYNLNGFSASSEMISVYNDILCMFEQVLNIHRIFNFIIHLKSLTTMPEGRQLKVSFGRRKT